MATEKTTSKKPTNTDKSGSNGGRTAPQFVQYTLTDDQLAAARAACEDMTDFCHIVLGFIETGYKFSISTDKYGGGVQAFLTPTEPGTANWGWTLTARAPDVESAAGVLAYKHYTLFDGIWPKEGQKRRGQTWG